MKLESLLQYLEEYLDVEGFPDHALAQNGLQVAGPAEIERLAVAVDASEAAILAAVERKADLLLVHHGLFWGGRTRVVGPRFRKLRALIQGGTALYGCHLPLDAHVDVGNCAVLCKELGWAPAGRFGAHQGREFGWWCEVDLEREELVTHVEAVVGGPVRLIPGGPAHIYRVGVVTGAASGLIPDAAEFGLDALITGEGAHHTFNDAMEFGMNALYAGHYATETWGVKALAAHIEERFGIPWEFIDAPTGL
jgi:dinuclear metal center YbgI/SA1388 family protein